MSPKRCVNRSLLFWGPVQEKTNVARHSAREIDDRGLELEALGLGDRQVAFIEFFCFPLKRLGPVGQPIVDGTSTVRAEV